MKITFIVIPLILAAMACTAQADIQLASFGTGHFSVDVDGSTFSSGVQTATSYEVIGNDFGSSLFGVIPSAIDITGNSNYLKLTATFSGAAKTSFQIRLYDSSASAYEIFLGSFAAFTPNVEMTITLTAGSIVGSFDPTKVTTIGLLTYGSGNSVDLTMKTLTASAVPEPTTYALFGAGALALFASGRSRFKAKASLH